MGTPIEDVQFTHRIEFPLQGGEHRPGGKLIDDACKAHNVHESRYGNILIALTEAVNNAIHHGNRQDASKQVTVGCEVEADRIIFPIRDEGPGFDHDHRPTPPTRRTSKTPRTQGVPDARPGGLR